MSGWAGRLMGLRAWRGALFRAGRAREMFCQVHRSEPHLRARRIVGENAEAEASRARATMNERILEIRSMCLLLKRQAQSGGSGGGGGGGGDGGGGGRGA